MLFGKKQQGNTTFSWLNVPQVKRIEISYWSLLGSLWVFIVLIFMDMSVTNHPLPLAFGANLVSESSVLKALQEW
jgi:hypothetical protein